MTSATIVIKNERSGVALHHVFMIRFIFVGLLAGFRHINYNSSHRIVFGRWSCKNMDDTDTRNHKDEITADAATNGHHQDFPSETDFASDLVLLAPPLIVTFDLSMWRPEGLWTIIGYSTHIGIMSTYLRQLLQPEEKLKAIAVGNVVGLAITVCCDWMVMWTFLLAKEPNKQEEI